MGNPISLAAMLISVAMMCVFLLYVALFPGERRVRFFAWVMVCRVLYACSVMLELGSESLDAKLWFRNMERTALVFHVPFMVLFVIDLYGKDKLLSGLKRAILFLVFIGWSAFIWTDSWHGQFRVSAQLQDGHLETVRSMYAGIFSLFCYVILVICLFFLIRYIRSAHSTIRRLGGWLLLFGSVPLMMEVLQSVWPGLSPWLLPLSVYTGFLGMSMLWIVFKYKLFSIVPLARNRVVDSMQEGMLIVNHKGKVIDCNAYTAGLFGDKASREFVGSDITPLLSSWSEWLELCERMEEGQIEVEIERKGTCYTYSVRVYPLLTERKRKQGTVSILFDMTESRRRLEQIAQMNRMKDRFVAAVSHDIRDPLAIQMSLISLMQEDASEWNDRKQVMLESLSEQMHRSFEMVDNLLDWFRSQQEGIRLHPCNVLLKEVIDNASAQLQWRGMAKQITIQVFVDESLVVYADREALALIVRNLLSNAIKFSYVGGHVFIEAREAEGDVQVTVRDNGIGLSALQLQQLFDDHIFHAGTGTEGEKGTGIGLLLCRQFVRLNGGRIWADSSLGQGSAFHFTLLKGDIDAGCDDRR